jgi:hypothetical protein
MREKNFGDRWRPRGLTPLPEPAKVRSFSREIGIRPAGCVRGARVSGANSSQENIRRVKHEKDSDSQFAHFGAVGCLLGTFLDCLGSKHEAAGRTGGSKQARSDCSQCHEAVPDINNAIAAGYGPFLGCVSGSDHGAMGIHYVNPSLLNGTIDATHPQALIYEPSDGQMKLVGVEFITDAATWLKNNSSPPVLDGQVFLFVDSPNRFNIPSFFELHVWAWRNNPQGAFVDWNNHVTCAGE